MTGTTILDQMLPPPKPRNEALERLIELTGQRVTMLETATLAAMAGHEYDEEAVAPPPGSPGEEFLREAARTFVRWINREGRFPQDSEIEQLAAEVAWQREAPGSRVAQAFVDLGLYYSAHAAAGSSLDVFGFQVVLGAAAEELIFTLANEYRPLEQ